LFFLTGTIFFSHNKSANSIFQPAYQPSRTAPKMASNSWRDRTAAPSRGSPVRATGHYTRWRPRTRRPTRADVTGRKTPRAPRIPWWGHGGQRCVPAGAGWHRAGSCQASRHARVGVAVSDGEAAGAANVAKRDAAPDGREMVRSTHGNTQAAVAFWWWVSFRLRSYGFTSFNIGAVFFAQFS
jgi:hypothetical protein